MCNRAVSRGGDLSFLHLQGGDLFLQLLVERHRRTLLLLRLEKGKDTYRGRGGGGCGGGGGGGGR